jgi:hypothetical protein
MWQEKIFKTREAMQAWLYKNEHRIQWQEIFVCNAYGLTYRKLRVI